MTVARVNAVVTSALELNGTDIQWVTTLVQMVPSWC